MDDRGTTYRNVGLCNRGDRVEHEYVDGSYYSYTVKKKSVQSIPSGVVRSWVNGELRFNRGNSPATALGIAGVGQRTFEEAMTSVLETHKETFKRLRRNGD